ncbi:uncharacterized protein LOC108101765 [Drosophila ficusphila]|uniref:uncharacterized protein LOC108101765 n=1 Tax=Drosophila ficusphila TaxID=30025 RepID=UPI0007E5E584|nr:uncharacterized protein LOC108101765 [Drosophila ficusphila]
MELAGIHIQIQIHFLQLLLLLLLLINSSSVQALSEHHWDNLEGHHHRMPERCTYLLQEEQVLERKCGGTYPLMAFTKYRDTFVKTGEPFALYMPKTLDHVMVVMKDSALQNCARFQMGDMRTFFCLDDNANETIRLEDAHMFCFPFHIQLPDDLMQECLSENNMKQRFLDDVLRTRRGVIHYTFGDSRGHRHIPGCRPPLALLLLLPPLILLPISRKLLCELP